MSLQQKNIALVLVFFVLLWVSYELSFSKTFALKKQLEVLKVEASLLENSDEKIQQLSRENNYYDSIFKAKQISSNTSFQNNLLTKINTYSSDKSIQVVNFKNPHVFKKEGTKVFTYAFTLRGNFNELTKLVYQLEQQSKLGKIISVSYLKKKDYRKRKDYLECTVLLQHVTNKDF